MPIYEYQCQDCGHKLEVLHRVSNPPKKRCPKCGGRLKKMISAPAIQFKGKGWYITDYARSGGGKEEGTKAKPKADKAPAAKKDSASPSSGKD